MDAYRDSFQKPLIRDRTVLTVNRDMDAYRDSFNELPKSIMHDINVNRNFEFVDGKQPNRAIKIPARKKRGKAIEWTTLEQELHEFDPTIVVLNVWNVNKSIRVGITPAIFSTSEEEREISELEYTIMGLIKNGSITEDNAVDMFTQEQIFNDKFEELKMKHADKEIIVCGNEIFLGDSFEEALEKARSKHQNRLFYSYSPTKEPITF